MACRSSPMTTTERDGFRFAADRAAVAEALVALAARADECLDPRIAAAVRYALLGAGKRLRAVLLLAAYRACGGTGDAGALAASVEAVHAYSLVHDDLPCMDDDSIRRGRPTMHRAFDVPIATIAGVTMVPVAVNQVVRGARVLRLERGAVARLVRTLMQASGAEGMVGGQLLDLDAEGRALGIAELEKIHSGKTGALIAAALVMGGIAARADALRLGALSAAGSAIGLAFQIADDVLDATQSSEALGKTAGRDAVLAKSTYASLLGVEPARRRSDALVSDALETLQAAGLRSERLEHLARFVTARRS